MKQMWRRVTHGFVPQFILVAVEGVRVSERVVAKVHVDLIIYFVLSFVVFC